MKLSKVGILALAGMIVSNSSAFSAGRRPPNSLEARNTMPISYFPQVERLADRYRLTVQTPQPEPHYLIEQSPKKIWLRLVRPSSDPSQVLEGDTVISEVRLVKRQYSADMIVKLGEDAVSNDVYFDEGKKNIVVDVFTSKDLNQKVAAAPVAATTSPVLKTKKQAKQERNLKKKQQIVSAKKVTPKPVVAAAITAAPAPVLKAAEPEPQLRAAHKESEDITIVVDAGHGGMDSGAIGVRGTLEKDINLEFAKQLTKALKEERKVRVIMTRDSDKFIPLQERANIANDAAGDLFVSVHCNSSLSPKHDGLETYFLSPDATDKAAASVARIENSVVALEAHKGAPSARLNQVLASMAVGTYINESSKFASLLCRNVRARTSEDKADVKEADFHVLRGAQMPAVLIELEYLSNPVSELKLRSSRYRSQLVKGVVEGIKAYNRQAKQEREAMASQLAPDYIDTSR